jgi:hypothetical protein
MFDDVSSGKRASLQVLACAHHRCPTPMPHLHPSPSSWPLVGFRVVCHSASAPRRSVCRWVCRIAFACRPLESKLESMASHPIDSTVDGKSLHRDQARWQGCLPTHTRCSTTPAADSADHSALYLALALTVPQPLPPCQVGMRGSCVGPPASSAVPPERQTAHGQFAYATQAVW